MASSIVIQNRVIRASVIVNAAGAWGDTVAGLCGVPPLGLEPRRRTAFTFDPGFDATGVPPIDEMGSGFYFKSSGPVLMVSPGDQTPSSSCSRSSVMSCIVPRFITNIATPAASPNNPVGKASVMVRGLRPGAHHH